MASVLENDAEPVAALDLGSNSFHMVVGRVLGDELSVLDRLRDPVRLASGLDRDGRLSAETIPRMQASLQMFGQRLREFAPKRVRAIATSTFRRAHRHHPQLIDLASDALGYPIEILSGPEEARLIYLGVSHDLARVDGSRLVVDIGGGSTECILGHDFTPDFVDSLHMGCVGYSKRFFSKGKLTRKAFQRAETAAQLELEPLQSRFRSHGWTEAVGSSGTIRAVGSALLAGGITDGTVTLPGIKKLRKAMMSAGTIDALELDGVTNERIPVLAGGLAILKAIFEVMDIEEMRTTKAALREGVLYDLLGRIRHEDVRDRTIRALSERYNVDEEQADRIERTALRAFDQVADSWKIERELGTQLLAWSARTHEIGLAISYSGHHRHGAYILVNSVMPGFARGDQERLAALVRGHRRKLVHEIFDGVELSMRESVFKLCVLLRLSVRLNRTRSTAGLPEFRLEPGDGSVGIFFPPGWLDDHPLTRADLEEEAALLRAAGFVLEFG